MIETFCQETKFPKENLFIDPSKDADLYKEMELVKASGVSQLKGDGKGNPDTKTGLFKGFMQFFYKAAVHGGQGDLM